MKPGLTPAARTLSRRILNEAENKPNSSFARNIKLTDTTVKTNSAASSSDSRKSQGESQDTRPKIGLSSYKSQPDTYYGASSSDNANGSEQVESIQQTVNDEGISAHDFSVTSDSANKKRTNEKAMTKETPALAELSKASNLFPQRGQQTKEAGFLKEDLTQAPSGLTDDKAANKLSLKESVRFVRGQSADAGSLTKNELHSDYVNAAKAQLQQKHADAMKSYKKILSSAAREIVGDENKLETKTWAKFDKLNESDPKKAKKFFLESTKSILKNADKLLKEACLTRLEKEGWDSQRSQIKTESGKLYTNEVIPENAFHFHLKNGEQVPLLEHGLQEGQGVSCYHNSKTTQHAANLWLTQLNTDSGEAIFAGVRHASLSSPDLVDVKEREDSALNKAKEVFFQRFI